MLLRFLADQFHLRAHAVRVRCASAQFYRDARRGVVVAINLGRTIRVADHHISVAVVVQIAHDHAAVRTFLAEAELVTDLFKFQIAFVAEQLAAHFQDRQVAAELLHFLHLLHRLGARHHRVGVHIIL